MRPPLLFRSAAAWLALGCAAPALVRTPAVAQIAAAESVRSADSLPHERTRGGSLERPVTLELVNRPLESVLEEIARQAGFTFGYAADVLPRGARVSLRARGRPAGEVLAAALRGTGVEARVLPNGQVTLVRRPAVSADAAEAQTGTVTGRVTDAATGAGLSGASVRVDGTRIGTLTDNEGLYRLEDIPPGDRKLVASMIGYSPVSRLVSVVESQETTADFPLSLSAVALDQVVVTGSVVPTEVRAVPTPISVVTADVIERQNILRVDQLFRGQIPGSLAWDQGSADYYNSIMVRGVNSFQTSSIKTYVDGVELSSSAFALIDPNSIERVEVIRGPEASTIYGSDASGGVMQIFTKKGDPSLGRPEVHGKVSFGGIQSPYASGPALRQDHSVSLLGGDGTFGYNLGVSYLRTGEWLPEYGMTSPSFFAGARMTQGRLSFSLSARAVNRTFAVTQSPAAVATGYTAFSRPMNQDSRNDQQTYGAYVGYQATPWWEHNLTIGVDQDQSETTRYRPRLTIPADTFLSAVNSATGKTSIAYNTSVSRDLGTAARVQLTAGADHYNGWSNSTVVSRALNTTGSISTDPRFPALTSRNRAINTGYFGQAQFGLRNALFVVAGLRADRNSGFGGSYGTAFAPRVGVSYVRQIGDITAKLRGAYGEGIRPPLPTQRDARVAPSYIQIENARLGPERQVGGDAGVELYFGRRASVSATYYDQTAIDLIDVVLVDASTAPPSYQYQNVGRIRNRGWELQGGLTTARLALNATYSLTNSTVRRLSPSYSGDLQVGDHALNVPRHTAGATLAWQVGHGTSLSATATYVGSWTSYDYLALYDYYYGGQPYRGSMRDYWYTYPSFVKANVGATQELRPGMEAFLQVENVGNSTPVEQNNAFTTYGRATTLGFRVRY